MSMKALLVTAAGVLAVSPAFAMSNSQIVRHTSGPIPYSQLASADKSGYNARSHHKTKAAATSDTSVAANATTSPAAAPAPEQAPSSAVNAPAPAAPDTSSPASTVLPPATVTPSPTPSPGATTPPSGQPQ